MPKFPRLFLIGSSDEEDPSDCTLALIAALHHDGFTVQHFRSVSAFSPVDHVTPVTGVSSRHLDPWIMDPTLCRELFSHTAAAADISIIEACRPAQMRLAPQEPPATQRQLGLGGDGDWELLAQTLNCPVVAVVPSQATAKYHGRKVPDYVDALLLDGVPSRAHFDVEKTAVESVSGKPVLGGLVRKHSLRDGKVKTGDMQRPGVATIEELRTSLLEVTDLSKVISLAHSRPAPSQSTELFAREKRRRLCVAIAYDDCFRCYFPDTLDVLEFLGAELREFSPLNDERLPEESDIVYFGCGHPEKFARGLSENECMRAALRSHVSSGRRVYAEGGGTAYLCQRLRLPSGVMYPMVGVFPAETDFTGSAAARPVPVELRCHRSTWIAAPGEIVRGYHSGAWRLRDLGGLGSCFASGADQPEIVVRHHCVGSMIHLNLAAYPRVLDAFFAPHAPSLCL